MDKPSVEGLEKGAKGALTKTGGFFTEFKDFVCQDNVLSLAVAVVFAAGLEAIINSLVTDIFSPLISLLGPGAVLEELFSVLRQGATPNVSYATRADAVGDGAITLNYGNFLQQNVNFLLIALCLFLFIKLIMYLTKKGPIIEYECPKCLEVVKEGAIRCPHCVAEPITPVLVEKEDKLEVPAEAP